MAVILDRRTTNASRDCFHHLSPLVLAVVALAGVEDMKLAMNPWELIQCCTMTERKQEGKELAQCDRDGSILSREKSGG